MRSSRRFFVPGKKIKENRLENYNEYNMTIEFKIQSVTLRTEDIQEYYPDLIPMIKSSLPQKKLLKRRKIKKKKTAAVLIDEIIDDIQTG